MFICFAPLMTFAQRLVREAGVGLECCPVSNQLLRYVADPRTHPAVHWLAAGDPVTLSSDDSTIYGYSSAAPTYDYFVAAVAWRQPLAALRQLGVNALLQSGLDDASKASALAVFDARWAAWIDAVAGTIKQ